MIEEFPEKLSGKTKTPWNENLFKVDPDSKHLETKQAKVFHTFVMKGMFLCKRGRQDIQPAVAESHQGREIIAIGALENGAFCTVFSENFHKF